MLALAAVLGIALLYSRRTAQDDEALVTGIAATVTAFVILSKVLSPQYLIWLAPLIALVGGRRGVLAGVLFLGAMFLSQFEGRGFEGLQIAELVSVGSSSCGTRYCWASA